MNELISTFHIDWQVMIAQLFNFVLVFIALYFIAAKPLRKLMTDRDIEIRKGLDDAKANAEMLANTAKESEITMRNARNEVNEMIKKNKKEEDKRKVEAQEKMQKEIADMMAQGKKSLEIEKEKMMTELKNEVAGLAIAATEKILAEKNK
ncbi:MAG: F0F1 ATP synthase subunit B [Candidatus Nomurabacteria bacterium]|nr:F0F1 ATP synthase subunit B [Candidatus Nomurabacteria bacterium]